jgi:hypothetical protein
MKKEERTKLSFMELSCSLLLPWPQVPHLAQTNNQTDLMLLSIQALSTNFIKNDPKQKKRAN